MTLEQRLLTDTIKTETCWFWGGTLTSCGYGIFTFETISYLAHRCSYQIYKGIIPLEKQIDHLCANKNCVNPEHLEAVSPQANSFRARKRSFNGNKTHCKNGHEYTPENTENHRGGRRCIKCRKLQRVLKYMWRGK